MVEKSMDCNEAMQSKQEQILLTSAVDGALDGTGDRASNKPQNRQEDPCRSKHKDNGIFVSAT